MPLSHFAHGPVLAMFPAEVLLTIFTYVHTTSKKSIQHTLKDLPSDSDTPLPSPILSPTFFPYAVAAVCRQWKQVVELESTFWTVLVAFVNANPIPTHSLYHQLTLSKNLPLEVFVTSRDKVDPTSRVEEKVNEYGQCRDIVRILMPHLHRIQTLSFDLNSTSSLPRITHDLYGPAPLLTTLILTADKDDGVPWDNAFTLQAIRSFSCPKVRFLDIDGHNFIYACTYLPGWHEILTSCRVLRLASYEPMDSDEELSMYDLMDILEHAQCLAYLTLDRFSLNGEFVSLDDGQCLALSPSSYSFVGLKRSFLDTFMKAVDWCNVGDGIGNVSFDDCELDGVHRPPYHLPIIVELRRIQDNMAAFLGVWIGSFHIIRCPGLDDIILRAIQYAIDGVSVRIEGCKGFSVDGLKEMVMHMNDGEHHDNLASLTVLEGPRNLTQNELEWFQHRIRNFTWSVV